MLKRPENLVITKGEQMLNDINILKDQGRVGYMFGGDIEENINSYYNVMLVEVDGLIEQEELALVESLIIFSQEFPESEKELIARGDHMKAGGRVLKELEIKKIKNSLVSHKERREELFCRIVEALEFNKDTLEA